VKRCRPSLLFHACFLETRDAIEAEGTRVELLAGIGERVCVTSEAMWPSSVVSD